MKHLTVTVLNKGINLLKYLENLDFSKIGAALGLLADL